MVNLFQRQLLNPPSGEGIWLGTITRIGGAGELYVQVGRHAGEAEYGPCLLVGTHTLAAGDRVAAAFAEGSPDDVIILGPVTDTNP